jgi:hypothetical protein
VRPQRVEGRRSARLGVTVRNDGNAAVRVGLGGSDPEDAVGFAFSPPTLAVPAGGEATAEATVSASSPRPGTKVERLLTISASAAQSRPAASAVFVQAAPLPRRRPAGLRFLVAILAAAALIGGAFLDWTPDDRGVCLSRDSIDTSSGTCLGYAHYLHRAHLAEVPTFDAGTLAPLFDFATSVGFLTLALGVLLLLRLRSERSGWVLGGLAVLVVAAELATVQAVGAGAVLSLLGGLAAMASAWIVSPRR